MSTNNQALLAAIYEKMPTLEIKRRIAEGQLVPAALDAAEAELAHRLALSDSEQKNTHEAKSSLPMTIGVVVTLCLVPIAYAYFFSPGLLLMVLIIGLTTMAAIFGKLFPTLGKIFGWLLVLSPVGLTALLWSEGALTMKYGDFRPLEAIVAYIALFMFSAFAIGLGGAFIKGATHSGKWNHFFRELDDSRTATLDDFRKLK